jgi:hypothetical protein
LLALRCRALRYGATLYCAAAVRRDTPLDVRVHRANNPDGIACGGAAAERAPLRLAPGQLLLSVHPLSPWGPAPADQQAAALGLFWALCPSREHPHLPTSLHWNDLDLEVRLVTMARRSCPCCDPAPMFPCCLRQVQSADELRARALSAA